MPIERRTSSAQIRSIVIAAASVLLAVTLGYAVIRTASGHKAPSTNDAGGGRWNVGDSATEAKSIRKDGPILIPDPAGAQRLPIYISHTGPDDRRGWHAFEARPPGAPASCFLVWSRSKGVFTAPCVKATYAPDGAGLRQLGATVDRNGDLIVDLTPG